MENITKEIRKNKERCLKLKEIRNNLDKPLIQTKDILKYLQELYDFEDVTSKEINVIK